MTTQLITFSDKIQLTNHREWLKCAQYVFVMAQLKKDGDAICYLYLVKSYAW